MNQMEPTKGQIQAAPGETVTMNGIQYTCDQNGNIIQKSIVNIGQGGDAEQAQGANQQNKSSVTYPIGSQQLSAPPKPSQEDDKKLYRQPVDDIVKYIESGAVNNSSSSSKAKPKAKQKKKDEDADPSLGGTVEEEGAPDAFDDSELTETKKKKRRRKNRKKLKEGKQDDSEDENDQTHASNNPLDDLSRD